jgi:putative heme-binding domain-containing protein
MSTASESGSSNAVGKVFIFLLIALGTFLWIGYAVTELTGGEKVAASVVEVGPEGGETIFWGKGRCFTCHSVGDRGSAVRGPNQGQFGEKFAQPIGVRSIERAAARSAETGLEYNRTDYLIESLANPGAFVVEGYKNEMAIVFAPPISLSLVEIKAVISYLQSQGGDVDLEALDNPSEVGAAFFAKIMAASAAGGGDPDAGLVVFEDNCMECHMIADEGGDIGPDLSAAAKIGLKLIEESITRPAKTITPGYETFEVIAQDGRKTVGIKTRDDADGIDITKATGEVVTIARADIKEITQDDNKSVMPEDLIEAITVKDFQDVLAYLMLQKGEE